MRGRLNDQDATRFFRRFDADAATTPQRRAGINPDRLRHELANSALVGEIPESRNCPTHPGLREYASELRYRKPADEN